MEVCAIDLTLNLLLPHVVLTHMTTRSYEIYKIFYPELLHENYIVCDSKIHF